MYIGASDPTAGAVGHSFIGAYPNWTPVVFQGTWSNRRYYISRTGKGTVRRRVR